MTFLTDLAAWFDGVKAEFILNFIDKNRWRMLVTGLGNTLLIALLACLIGIALGVVVAILRTTWDNAGATMRKGPARWLFAFFNRVCLIYTTIIRGTPYQCVQSKQRGYSRIKTKAKPCRNSSELTLERMAKNTEGQKQTKHECKRHKTKTVAWLPQTKTSVHGRQPDGQAKTGERIGQAALLQLVATTHVIL